MNETLKRGISGAVYVILLIVAISHSPVSFTILFGFFLLQATLEFSSIVKINKLIASFLSLLFFVCFANPLYFKNYWQPNTTIAETGLVIISLISSIKCLCLLFDDSAHTISNPSKYFFLFGYLIIPFILITKIPYGTYGYNPKIMISIFILIWVNDTFAYIVGKSIGKKKLLERVSPKKTIEGFIGGLLFCVLASCIISKYYIQIKESNMYIWVIIAIIVGVFGTLGDLVESKLKRIAGVKDSGNIMPGHGGVLDRLDSIIFVAPFVFTFYQILHYVS